MFVILNMIFKQFNVFSFRTCLLDFHLFLGSSIANCQFCIISTLARYRYLISLVFACLS